ncbi:MAG: hypothetical protein ABIG45_00660, partial [Bacillota bacterium]
CKDPIGEIHGFPPHSKQKRRRAAPPLTSSRELPKKRLPLSIERTFIIPNPGQKSMYGGRKYTLYTI